MQPRSPKMPHFDESTDDMDAYIRRFERYAISQKWEHDFWATNLSTLLKGRALDVYALLSPDQSTDYEILKTSLLQRFQLTEDGFKQKFRKCRPESGESFQQFVVRLSGYFQRWIEMSKSPSTFHGLFDLMMRDQLLHICNRDLTLFLKERIPENIEQMARYADQYREARNANITALIFQTDNAQKVLKQKPQQMQQCQQRKQEKQTGKVNDKNNFQKKRCYYCGKQGHIASNCFEKKGTVAVVNIKNGSSS